MQFLMVLTSGVYLKRAWKIYSTCHKEVDDLCKLSSPVCKLFCIMYRAGLYSVVTRRFCGCNTDTAPKPAQHGANTAPTRPKHRPNTGCVETVSGCVETVWAVLKRWRPSGPCWNCVTNRVTNRILTAYGLYLDRVRTWPYLVSDLTHETWKKRFRTQFNRHDL